MKSNRVMFLFQVVVIMFATSVFGQEITTVGEVNQIDVDGNPLFAGLKTMDRYIIDGLVLNDCDVFNRVTASGDPEQSFIVFLLDDTGGIEVYSGSWYGGGLILHPDVKQGDRIRVTGLTGHYGGKTNMNDRHNPDQKFEITLLSSGNPLVPIPLDSLAGLSEFDHTRQSGGEYYQGRLVTLKNVQIVEGDWIPGGILTVVDSQGNTLQVELMHQTLIGDNPEQEGLLDITGIFNQEDTEAPFTDHYLLWPRSINDFQPAEDLTAIGNWDVY